MATWFPDVPENGHETHAPKSDGHFFTGWPPRSAFPISFVRRAAISLKTTSGGADGEIGRALFLGLGNVGQVVRGEQAVQAYDFIILVLLAVATVWGASRGLAKQLATLFSLGLGYFVAVKFRGDVATFVKAPEPWNQFAAMLGLFLITSFLVWGAFQIVHSRMKDAGLGNFDMQMGGLLGLLKGAVLAMVLTMFSVVMLGETQRDAVLGSVSGYQICRGIQYSKELLPLDLVPAEWRQVMEPYLKQLDQPHLMAEQEPVIEAPALLVDVLSPSDVLDASRYEDADFGELLPTMPGESSNANDLSSPAQARLKQPIFSR